MKSIGRAGSNGAGRRQRFARARASERSFDVVQNGRIGRRLVRRCVTDLWPPGRIPAALALRPRESTDARVDAGANTERVRSGQPPYENTDACWTELENATEGGPGYLDYIDAADFTERRTNRALSTPRRGDTGAFCELPAAHVSDAHAHLRPDIKSTTDDRPQNEADSAPVA